MPEYEWRTALLETEAEDMAKLRVGLLVATYGDYKTGRNVRPSNTSIGQRLGYSREWTNKQVRKLVADGWLTRSGTKGPKGVIDYMLTLPHGQEEPTGSPVNPSDSHNLSNNNKKAPAKGPKGKNNAALGAAGETFIGIMPMDYDYEATFEWSQSEEAPF